MKLLALSAFACIAFGGAAMACPDYTQWGSTYAYTGGDLWVPRDFSVTAGGDNSMYACGHSYGEGYFTSAPDFTFDLRGMSGYQLAIRVVSACDAALLVNTANAAWYYDDDSNGNLDPAMVLTAPGDGYLDVWVGTYDGAYCDATLTLETL